MGKKNFTKVVDQDGQPVVDAKVQANVEKVLATRQIITQKQMPKPRRLIQSVTV